MSCLKTNFFINPQTLTPNVEIKINLKKNKPVGIIKAYFYCQGENTQLKNYPVKSWQVIGRAGTSTPLHHPVDEKRCGQSNDDLIEERHFNGPFHVR